MEELIGYLLPLIVAWAWLPALSSHAGRLAQSRPGLWLLVEVCLLAAVAAATILVGPVRFDGPHWMWFDPHRGIALTFELTAWSLAGLLLLAWIRLAGRTCPSRTDGDFDVVPATLLGGLTLLLLADDLCLFAVGWAVVMLASPERKQGVIPPRARAAAALRLYRLVRAFSIVPLVAALGLLLGEFHVSSWSEWEHWIRSADSFHDSQLATFTLTGFAILLAVLLSAALFPWASFVVDSPCETNGRRRTVGLCGWMLPALTLLWKWQAILPLESAVAQLGAMLALLTMLTCGVAALRQSEAARTLRALACAHLALSLLGLIQTDGTLRTAGAGHALLSLVWICCWGSLPVSGDKHGRMRVRAGSAVVPATVLLHAGFDGSWNILSRSSIPGGVVLALLLWFVLGVAAFRLAFAPSRGRAEGETVSPGQDQPITPGAWALIPAGLIVCLYVVGNDPSGTSAPREHFTPLAWEQWFSNLEFPAATVLSAALAGVWVRTFVDREMPATPDEGAFARLADSHFHLTDLWNGACLVPARLAGLGIAALEGTRWDAADVAAVEEDAEARDLGETTRELVLGALCAAALVGLLLWWSR